MSSEDRIKRLKQEIAQAGNRLAGLASDIGDDDLAEWAQAAVDRARNDRVTGK